MKTAKYLISGGVGLIGSIVTYVVGPWSNDLNTLLVLMAIDICLGVLCAAVFGSSSKTEDGGLSSSQFKVGIIRKIVTFIYVAVAYQIDKTLGWDTLRAAAIYSFIAYELISIVENAGLMGIPLPSVFYDAISVLKQKGGIEDKTEETEEEETEEEESGE